jgi:hypothetical protein
MEEIKRKCCIRVIIEAVNKFELFWMASKSFLKFVRRAVDIIFLLSLRIGEPTRTIRLYKKKSREKQRSYMFIC